MQFEFWSFASSGERVINTSALIAIAWFLKDLKSRITRLEDLFFDGKVRRKNASTS